MVESKEAVERRRERGRRSQAAFRKRQAKATQSLADEHKRLQEAVRAVVDAARAGRQVELRDGINGLATVVGMDTLPNSLCAGLLDRQVPQENSTTTDVIEQRHHEALVTANTSAWTQSLAHGTWVDPLRYMRVTEPPEDIVPYLHERSKTLSGRLFWSLIEHGNGACGRSHPKPLDVIRRNLDHSDTMREVQAMYILAGIKARLEYKKTGSMSPEYAGAAETGLTSLLHARVERELLAKGDSPNLWLTCLGIEEHVNRVAGSKAVKMLTSMLASQDSMGDHDLALRTMGNDLLCRLYSSSVCFGNGPRWHIDVVNEIFFGRA